MVRPRDWKRIDALVDELLSLAPEARARRLEALTRGDGGDSPEGQAGCDVATREQVLAILAEHDRAGGPLDDGLEALVGGAFDEGASEANPTPLAGARIGPYRVVRELGRGGMGEVLLAERADGAFQHRVALKVVRAGVGREDVLDRFHHERRILAQLRHPNIASLYDGGAADDGTPYFAMEVVEGEPITRWADGRRLGVDERVRLFESVCRAVSYAHAGLVVHRDLKPSNVLVTADGTVKLLDFGIAKLVDPERAEATQTTGGFLTPAYASPEQLRGEAATTATDVYSLGVLLYDLLSGHHPHGDTRHPAPLIRAILDSDAPSPSSVAGSDSATRSGEEIAAARGTRPAELRRRLRGDLDTIVEKALRKRADERYESVEALRRDLERYRDALPVSARAATRRYRMKKFARRHRVGVVAGGAVTLSLVVGLLGVAWQAGVAARERDRARAEAERAAWEASRAGAVKDYLVELFSSADPTFDSGETLTVAELVERGASRVSSRFDENPALRAEITVLLGTVLRSLARYDRADTLLRSALELIRPLEDPRQLASTLLSLADNLGWQGRHEEAEALLREALETQRGLAEPDGRTLQALSALGGTYTTLGRFEEATATLLEGIRVAPEIPGHNELEIAKLHGKLANVHRLTGELEEAERHARDALALALALAEQADPRGSVGTGLYLSALAKILEQQGRIQEAEAPGRRALELHRREYGPNGHPFVAVLIMNLAGTLRRLGNLEEAETLQLEAVEIVEHHLGSDHHFVAQAYNNLAVTRIERKDFDGAAGLLDEAVRILSTRLGTKHPSVVALMRNRANNLHHGGHVREAEAAARETLALAREVLPGDHPQLAFVLVTMGDAAAAAGKPEEAARCFREAHRIRVARLGEDHPETRDARERLERLEE